MKKIILLVILVSGIAKAQTFNFSCMTEQEIITRELVFSYSTLTGVIPNHRGNEWGRSATNWVMDVLSDDAHKGSTNSDQRDLHNLEIGNWPATGGYFLAKYEVMMHGMEKANEVIRLVEASDDPFAYAQALAQARFLKGHYAFELKRIFDQGQWADIESDFTYAKDNLQSSSANRYAVTPTAAQAYLGKVQLYQNDFGRALHNLEAVVNSGQYSLHPNINDNFRSSTENGAESVFAIHFDAGERDDSGSYGYYIYPASNDTSSLNHTIGVGGWCCGFYQPTQDLADAFQTENGLPLLDTFQDTHITNDFGIRTSESFTAHTGPLDPRIDYTMGRRGVDFNGYGPMLGSSWVRGSFSDIGGPYVSKKNAAQAQDPANWGVGGWGQQLLGQDHHIIRYADVLLMAAEAAIEIGQLEKGKRLINIVRNRAKNMDVVRTTRSMTRSSTDGNGVTTTITTRVSMPSANYNIEPYLSFSSTTMGRKAVRHERRLELGMEGHRWFDLRRWGNAQQVMLDYYQAEAETITSFSASYQGGFFPIPTN